MNPTSQAAPRSDLFDVLTIYNPSETPFEVWYNSELHAVIQPKKAVQLVKLIAGDAHYGAVKHLIDRMCRLQGKSVNDPMARNAWYEVVIVKQARNELPKVPTLLDQARAVNQSLTGHPIDVMPIKTPPQLDANGTAKKDPTWKFDPVTGARLDQKPVITPDQIDTSHIEIQGQGAETILPQGAMGTVPAVALPSAPIRTGDTATDNLLGSIRKGDEEDARVIGEVPAAEEPAALDEPKRTANPTKEDLITYAKDVLMMDVNDPQTRLELEKQTVDELKNTLKYDIYA